MNLGDFFKSLFGSGLDPVSTALLILACVLIWRGPTYLKVVLSYLNERRKIKSELDRKLKKFDLEIEEKKARIEKLRGKGK